jgi:hypothetical protein
VTLRYCCRQKYVDAINNEMRPRTVHTISAFANRSTTRNSILNDRKPKLSSGALTGTQAACNTQCNSTCSMYGIAVKLTECSVQPVFAQCMMLLEGMDSTFVHCAIWSRHGERKHDCCMQDFACTYPLRAMTTVSHAQIQRSKELCSWRHVLLTRLGLLFWSATIKTMLTSYRLASEAALVFVAAPNFITKDLEGVAAGTITLHAAQ